MPRGRRQPPGTTSVWHQGRRRPAALLERAAMPRRFQSRGPAIVLEEGATLWVPPGWSLRSHVAGTLIAERSRKS